MVSGMAWHGWHSGWHGVVCCMDGMAWWFYGMYVAWHGIDRVMVRVFAYGRMAWHGGLVGVY